MKCPHCGRTWDNQDVDQQGFSRTVVLMEHVQRFCPGTPDPHSLPRGARPLAPAARSRPLLP